MCCFCCCSNRRISFRDVFFKAMFCPNHVSIWNRKQETVILIRSLQYDANTFHLMNLMSRLRMSGRNRKKRKPPNGLHSKHFPSLCMRKKCIFIENICASLNAHIWPPSQNENENRPLNPKRVYDARRQTSSKQLEKKKRMDFIGRLLMWMWPSHIPESEKKTHYSKCCWNEFAS